MKGWILAASDLPALRPPRGAIPPSFLERYGWTPVVLGSAGALLVLAIVWWRWRRPVFTRKTDAIVTARQQLEALRSRAEGARSNREISAIVRRYVQAVMDAEQEQFTTAEIIHWVSRDQLFQAGGRAALAEFLQECDREEFAAGRASPPPQRLDRARQLVDQLEAQRPRRQPASA